MDGILRFSHLLTVSFKYMNIGFDLDKVLINYPPLVPGKLIDRLYKKRDNGILLYRIPSRIEQIFRLVTHYPALRQPIKENLSFVRKLTQQKNNKYFLISSRFGFLKHTTQRLVKKHELDKIFDELVFNYDNQQPHVFKDEAMKKHHIDLYIDDDLSLLKYLAKHNKNTRFFWLNDTNIGRLKANLFGVNNLPEIFNNISHFNTI